jgi:hypothetical protein
MMRWVLLVVLVVLVSAAVPLVLTALPTEDESVPGLTPVGPERDGPVGAVELSGDTDYDFGYLALGNSGKHTWTIKNVGEGPLDLLKGSSTCSCTVANFEKDPRTGVTIDKLTLKPGETHEITVSWTPKTGGKFGKETSVETNDPKNPVIWFRIRGEVKPAIVTVPASEVLDLGRVFNSEGLKTKMAMASPDRPETKVLKATSSRPELIEAEIVPLDEEDLKELEFKSGYRINFTVKPSTEIGNFREEVVFETDHPQMKTLTITVTGRLEGPISVVPPSIRINGATSSDGGSRSVVLSVTDHRETKFDVAEKPENCQVEIQPASKSDTGKARLYKMTVSVPPGTPPGVIRGDIVLKTDHPGVSHLSVPFEAVVLGGQ